MAIEIRELPRVFKYNSVELPDPGANLSAEDVRELYSATYPEILNASIEGPEDKDGRLVYEFKRAVGTKGSDALRARLEAIAAGNAAPGLAPDDVQIEAVRKAQPAFLAWRGFAGTLDGEPLDAPAAALAPLP